MHNIHCKLHRVCEACTCTFYMCGVWVGVSDWVCV